jgi:hypothetical protein
MKIFLTAATVAMVLMLSVSTSALAGWGIWQTTQGYCALFEDGKKKGEEFVRQIEGTHATYKDALMRIQELLKSKTCSPRPAS